MALTVRSDAGGTFGAVQFNAEDILRIDATKTKAAPGKTLEATSADQATNATNATLAATATVALAAPGGTPFGFRNKIINGDMRIWQRGTSANSSNQFAVDRWMLETNIPAGAGVNLTQYSDASISNTGIYHIAVQTTAIGTVGAGNFAMAVQRIEGLNIQDLKFGTAAAKTITLSFRANTNQPNAVMSVALRGVGATRSYVTTVALTGVPTNYTITIPGDTTGAWVTDNGVGIAVSFSHSVGTTFQTSTLNVWQNGNFIGAPAQTQMFQIASAAFNVSDVQLEIGNVATPFEKRPISVELAMCQRYYEKSFPYATAPAQNAGSTGCHLTCQIVAASQNQRVSASPTFKVTKRIAAAVTVYNPSAVNAQARNFGTGTDCTATSLDTNSDTGFSYQFTTPAASFAGHSIGLHWAADAEL